VQYEMTLESLENKRGTLEDYERSEAEAQRLASALSAATAPRRPSASPSLTPNNNTVTLPGTPPTQEGQGQGPSPRMGASPAASADSLTQSPTQVSIPDADELDANDPWGQAQAQGSVWGQGARSQAWANRISSGLSSTIGGSSAAVDTSASTATVGPSASASTASGVHKRGSSGAKGILNALSYSFQGIMDVDPEAARRSGISKTRDSISQLEDTLLLSAQDLKYASSTIQADLDRFQRQKVADIRDMCIAMAIAHREWAKNNLSAWEEAKQEIAKIEPHPNRPPGASDGAGPSSPRP